MDHISNKKVNVSITTKPKIHRRLLKARKKKNLLPNGKGNPTLRDYFTALAKENMSNRNDEDDETGQLPSGSGVSQCVSELNKTDSVLSAIDAVVNKNMDGAHIVQEVLANDFEIGLHCNDSNDIFIGENTKEATNDSVALIVDKPTVDV